MVLPATGASRPPLASLRAGANGRDAGDPPEGCRRRRASEPLFDDLSDLVLIVEDDGDLLTAFLPEVGAGHFFRPLSRPEQGLDLRPGHAFFELIGGLLGQLLGGRYLGQQAVADFVVCDRPFGHYLVLLEEHLLARIIHHPSLRCAWTE